jgi:hypothetical protein
MRRDPNARGFGGPFGRDLAAHTFFDRVQGKDVVLAGERDGHAFQSGAARAPDAVHVVLGVFRQVVVDDVRDRLDVEAARSDVGGHEDRQLAVLEIAQDLEPLFLRDVAR